METPINLGACWPVGESCLRAEQHLVAPLDLSFFPANMRSSLCHSCCAVCVAGVAVAQGAASGSGSDGSSGAPVTETDSTFASATQTAAGSAFSTTAGIELEGELSRYLATSSCFSSLLLRAT